MGDGSNHRFVLKPAYGKGPRSVSIQCSPSLDVPLDVHPSVRPAPVCPSDEATTPQWQVTVALLCVEATEFVQREGWGEACHR